jgi:ABC-type transporter Mla subunit MlaD
MKNIIHESLKRNKPVSLRILLEEDSFPDSAFEGDVDENSAEGKRKKRRQLQSNEGDENSESDVIEEPQSYKDDDVDVDVQVEELTSQVDAMKQSIDITKTDDGTSSVESYVSSAVSSLGESIKRLNDLSRFLLEEESKDEDLSDVEDDIDSLDRILSKGNELVAKFKKGKNLNINSYVDAAINAYRNFDSLFSKELIVKQATINVIVLNSGAKAKENVREFEELFHESLHKNFDIEYEEHALITNKSNTASGAKSQG